MSSPTSRPSVLRWLLLGLFVLVVAGCASDAPLDTLDPAGQKAEDIDSLFIPVFWVATVVFVIIQGGVLFMWWRFRVPNKQNDNPDDHAGYGDEEFPEQVHGHFAAEIGWTIAPAIILLVIGIFSVALILDLDDVEASPNASYGEMEIVVVGHRGGGSTSTTSTATPTRLPTW